MRELTEQEDSFLRSLNALMIRHKVDLDVDPNEVLVFNTFDSAIFLSIGDIHHWLWAKENIKE